MIHTQIAAKAIKPDVSDQKVCEVQRSTLVL